MSLSVTLEAWQREMKEKFPLGSSTVAFICPACKNVATVADFENAGLTSNDAPQQCLFRTTEPSRCDWVAFGLFRGPRIVIAEDGHEIPVFEFAEVDSQAAAASTNL